MKIISVVKNFRRLFISIMLVFLGIFGISPVYANGLGFAHKINYLPKYEQDKWQFLLAPYGWFTWIRGDMTVKGRDAKVDVEPSDVIKALDFVAELHFEAKKGNWSLMADPTYVKLSDTVTSGPVKADMDYAMTLVDFGVYYKLGSYFAKMYPDKEFSVEGFVGGRYMKLEPSLKLKLKLPPIPAPIPIPTAIKFSETQDWLDPVIGARFRYHVAQNWWLAVHADIGGFGIESESTWTAKIMALYKFSKHVGATLGFRALGENYRTGHGANKFKIDTVMYGPVVGITFHF